MSRSRRKHPYVTELQRADDSKQRKRRANRAVRREAKRLGEEAELASGSEYKKLYQSWNISDYNFYMPDYKKARRK